jgi:DNA repair exonuclease SbcCD ATPase subunit
MGAAPFLHNRFKYFFYIQPVISYIPTIDFESQVEATIDSIQANDEIHPDNKALIEDFKRDLKLKGLSDAWLQKLTSHLKVIAEHIGETRFEDMDENDIKDFVEWAQGRDLSALEAELERTASELETSAKQLESKAQEISEQAAELDDAIERLQEVAR